MHSDELRKLNEGIEDPALYKIINELITRSGLQTGAIVALGDKSDYRIDAIATLVAHTAEPKKNKPTAEDIRVVVYGNGWAVRCRDMWVSTTPYWWTQYSANILKFHSLGFAEIVAAGLRATNNLPEEYK